MVLSMQLFSLVFTKRISASKLPICVCLLMLYALWHWLIITVKELVVLKCDATTCGAKVGCKNVVYNKQHEEFHVHVC